MELWVVSLHYSSSRITYCGPCVVKRNGVKCSELTKKVMFFLSVWHYLCTFADDLGKQYFQDNDTNY